MAFDRFSARGIVAECVSSYFSALIDIRASCRLRLCHRCGLNMVVLKRLGPLTQTMFLALMIEQVDETLPDATSSRCLFSQHMNVILV